MKHLAWFVAFAISAPIALVSAAVGLFAVSRPVLTPTQTAQAFEPRVLAAATQYLQAYEPQIPQIEIGLQVGDSRAKIIKKYLADYDSPLTPFTEAVVSVSDKYQVDPYLIVAIAQQESNLCKAIPPDSHNCWGYGIYGDKVTMFADYPEALEIVISGIRKNYIDMGLRTPEEIMQKYTPPSVDLGGPWARGVSQFMGDLDQ